MSDKGVTNRWWTVVAAMGIQLCLGVIYAWSVFTPSLIEAGWTKTQTQSVFAVGLASFAITTVVSGQFMPKLGPRRLALAGGLVLGLSYMAAGLLGTSQFSLLFILLGVTAGVGIGLAYIVPIAVGMSWFPDKKGLITGLAVAGFGFGAMIWVKLAGDWGNLIASHGLSQTLMTYGILFLAITLPCAWRMVSPPKGWQPPVKETRQNTAARRPASTTGEADLKGWAMLKTPQFIMIFLTFVFGAGAGLMCIGLMKLFPTNALEVRGITKTEAEAIAGTAMAIYFALANGLGRIAWGAISDRIGQRNSLIIMTASQGVVVILFQWMAGTPGLLFLGAALIGFNFGGNFALFPAIVAATFGAKNVGQNYGWVFLAYGVGGIGGPILGGVLGDMGNFPLAFTICGVLCLAAAGIISLVKPPRQLFNWVYEI